MVTEAEPKPRGAPANAWDSAAAKAAAAARWNADATADQEIGIDAASTDIAGLVDTLKRNAVSLTQSPLGRLALSTLMSVARDKRHAQRVAAARALADIAGLQAKQAQAAREQRTLAEEWRKQYLDAGVEPPSHLR